MRLEVLTLTEACLFLFLCPPAQGQTFSKAPCGDPQKAAEDKAPIAIVELGAATNWNPSGGAATFAANLAGEVTPIGAQLCPKLLVALGRIRLLRGLFHRGTSRRNDRRWDKQRTVEAMHTFVTSYRAQQ